MRHSFATFRGHIFLIHFLAQVCPWNVAYSEAILGDFYQFLVGHRQKTVWKGNRLAKSLLERDILARSSRPLSLLFFSEQRPFLTKRKRFWPLIWALDKGGGGGEGYKFIQDPRRNVYGKESAPPTSPPSPRPFIARYSHFVKLTWIKIWKVIRFQSLEGEM